MMARFWSVLEIWVLTLACVFAQQSTEAEGGAVELPATPIAICRVSADSGRLEIHRLLSGEQDDIEPFVHSEPIVKMMKLFRVSEIILVTKFNESIPPKDPFLRKLADRVQEFGSVVYWIEGDGIRMDRTTVLPIPERFRSERRGNDSPESTPSPWNGRIGGGN
jgi:hypothetical protein